MNVKQFYKGNNLRNRLICWWKGHKWKYLYFSNYMDTSFDDRGVPSHTFTRRCVLCNKLEDQCIYNGGHVNIKDYEND